MRTRLSVFKLAAAVLIAAFVFAGCKKKAETTMEQTEEPASRKAAAFVLENYDGSKVSLNDYKGKIVVLEWFNYDCPFVVYHYEKAGTMKSLAEKYKDRGVVWLAINSTNSQETAKNKDFAQKYDIPYPILDDRKGDVGRAYGAKTSPHMFVIDKDGTIVYSGAIDDSPMGKNGENVTNYVLKALDELLTGEPISTPKTNPYGCSVKY
jgi:peroxiredoxin